MKPIDYRHETWERLQTRLHGQRLAALHAWRTHGPGTTRQVAQRSGLDLLTLRPRTTELYQLGLVALVAPATTTATATHPTPPTPHEGTYRALDPAEAHALFTTRRTTALGTPTQRELALA